MQQQPILYRDSSQTSTKSSSSHQLGSSAQQSVEDQNSSDSQDTQQQVLQTGFEINRQPLQQTEHDTTNASLSLNIVKEQQFISAADSQTSSNGQSQTNYSLMTRPPKVKIEPFDGNPMKWSMWFGLFEATIHNQPISDAEKMTHLQTLTTGKSNHAISGYSCNSTMYSAALHELRRRYGRPDIIINDFINRIPSFKQQSTHRRDSYMEFSTFISNMVETLQTLGFKDDLNSTIYIQFAVSKLQPHQQLHGTQYITAQNIDQPNLIAFNNWIKQFALACDPLPPMQPQQMTLVLSDRQQIAPRLRHAN